MWIYQELINGYVETCLLYDTKVLAAFNACKNIQDEIYDQLLLPDIKTAYFTDDAAWDHFVQSGQYNQCLNDAKVINEHVKNGEHNNAINFHYKSQLRILLNLGLHIIFKINSDAAEHYHVVGCTTNNPDIYVYPDSAFDGYNKLKFSNFQY